MSTTDVITRHVKNFTISKDTKNALADGEKITKILNLRIELPCDSRQPVVTIHRENDEEREETVVLWPETVRFEWPLF